MTSRAPDGISDEAITITARRVLLDAIEALQAHPDAITLVGAQAVALRTAGVETLATPSYTSDADLGIDPAELEDEPRLEATMRRAGFTQGPDPGHWHKPMRIGDRVEDVVVDLMLAESFSKPGSRRSGIMSPHSRKATRKTAGLESAAVDYDVMSVSSLEPHVDTRVIELRVAGAMALLVAKCHKLGERYRAPGQRRLVAKDAGDVLRLILATDIAPLRTDSRSEKSARQGLEYLEELFGAAGRQGVVMAISALATDVPADHVRALAPAYTAELLRVAAE